MTSLYTITDTIRQMQDAIEHDNVPAEALAEVMKEWEGELETKLENTQRFVQNLQANAKAKKDEAKRLTEQAKSEENQAERLLKGMEVYLAKIGKTEVRTPLFTFKFQKGREVVDIDESKLPRDYWVENPKPMSKTDLKKLIESGKEIEGARIVRKPDYLKVK